MKKATTIKILLAIFDIVMANLAYGIALWFRFDCRMNLVPRDYLEGWFKFIPIFAACVLAVHLGLRLYDSIWRYVSYNEVIRVGIATVVTFALNFILSRTFFVPMPISYYFVGFFIQFVFIAGIRMSYRAIMIIKDYYERETKNNLKRILIIGAGEAGRLLIRETKNHVPMVSKVIGLVDDNASKQGRSIEGIRVLGTVADVPSLVKKHKIDSVIIAIPSLDVVKRKEIINKCKGAGCQLQILAGVENLICGDVDINNIRQVDINELLGRDTIDIDNHQIKEFIKGKTVLVTGGGGSIGSELVRQIAVRYPKKLIVIDIYENNAYDIQQEILRTHPELDLEVLIGSVRDEKRINDIMKTYLPDIVFHAAAHKHVPLMENSPNEAIKNNAIGTLNTARAAAEAGASRFVLISTDKAVNPTNIMGASKRLCEMIIQVMNENYNTEFVAVRFGNVLGSNGSVVPLFQKQIESGGPVTVTHPEITRFFMTIPEAVSLVLQAGTFAKGGEIFVLDMGEPVKIADLANNMIYLAGFVPDVDIKIKYTGLRPGEKLYEEILMDEEGLEKTENSLIFIGHPTLPDKDFISKLQYLEKMAVNNDENIKEYVASLVETYDIKARVNNK